MWMEGQFAEILRKLDSVTKPKKKSRKVCIIFYCIHSVLDIVYIIIVILCAHSMMVIKVVFSQDVV